MPALRKWTILMYMAGDAGALFEGPITGEQLFDSLQDEMVEALEELRRIGSSEEVDICVQFDSLVEQQAFRWHVPAADVETPEAPRAIGNLNTGEPDSLSAFAAWAAENWPAENYALVIWGHGSGWDESRIYDRYPRAKQVDQDRTEDKKRLIRRGIFGSTVAGIMGIEDDTVRGLCYDDSARDFLDNAELQKALRDSALHLGKDRLDLLVLDACLMNMAEVAYQVRDEVAYLVGSEGVVPANITPWDRILSRLFQAPDSSARELAIVVGEETALGLGNSRGVDDVTQSVLDLSRASILGDLLDRWAELARAVASEDFQVERALEHARDKCLRFAIPGQKENNSDYVDLFDFVHLFVQRWTGEEVDEFMAREEQLPTDGELQPGERLRKLTRELLGVLTPGGGESVVVRNFTTGYKYEKAANGLSIYLPNLTTRRRHSREVSPQYGNLAFSDTSWPDLICALYSQASLPTAFVEMREQRRAREKGST